MKFLMVILVALGAGAGESAANRDMPHVRSLCEMVEQPGRSPREVELTALRYTSLEADLLFDPKCNNRDFFVWLDLSELSETLRAPAAKGGYASGGVREIDVHGRFEPFDGEGYGHLAMYRQRLVVSELVERAARGQASTPAFQAKAPRSDAVATVLKLDNEWHGYSNRSSRSELGTLLGPAYTYVEGWSPARPLSRSEFLASPVLPDGRAWAELDQPEGKKGLSWTVRVFLSEADLVVVGRRVSVVRGESLERMQAIPGLEWEYDNTWRKSVSGWSLSCTRVVPLGAS